MAMGIAAVAGAFSVLVVLLMLADYRLRLNKDPLDSAPYAAMKTQLAKEPRNENLKRQIRLMDLHLREAYFRQRQFTSAGGWLLLGGTAVTLAALLWVGSLRKRLPQPSLQPVAVDLYSPIARSARWLVAAMGLVLAGAAIGLSMTYRSPLPGDAGLVASSSTAGQASSGTRGQASNGTRGQASNGTRGQASNGTRGQASNGTRGQANNGTRGQASNGTGADSDARGSLAPAATPGLEANHAPGVAAQASSETHLSTPPGVAAGANVHTTPQVSAATPQVSAATPQVSAATPQVSAATPQVSAAMPAKGSTAMPTKSLVTTTTKPEPSKPVATVAVAGDYPSDAEIAANWPRFRGPAGLGVAKHKNVPTTWDVPGGKGLAWKSPVPLSGNSSPVVWKDRVFVTGGSIDQRQVYCYSTTDGKLLWQHTVAGQANAAAKLKDLPDEGGAGFASPTPATDGRRVYAIFATGDVVALDFAGKPVWTRSLGVPKSSYGFASSPTLYRGRLLIQFDQGSAKDKLSKLLALDAATGKTVWETPREVPNSWTSPIVVLVGGRPEIITSADPYVIAYDPQNGGEIWRVKCLRQDVGPSPTFCGGTVYAVSQFPQLSAIRADGKGDISKTNVLWVGEDGLPDTCSPLASEEFVLLLSSDGVLTCYEAKQGEKLWEEEFKDSNFSSSPTFVGKQIYLFSNEGKSWVVEPTREKCLRIAEGNLGEKCVASPAFQDGRVYIRGEKNLFCLGK